MTAPRVSVLIPCYNAEAYVAQTLESVFAQTWPNIEVVVVDDGSTDASAAVVAAMARPNLTLVRQDNRGQTAALNVALAHAGGDFVQYLDADDLIDPEKIAVQMARLQGRPRSVASARWGRFYGAPQDTRFEEEAAVQRDLAPLDWLAASRAGGLGMMFPALWLIPMPLVREAGPWNERLTLNNDAEYFTRLLLTADQVLYCPEARCRYRSGLVGNLSGRKGPAHWRSQFAVIDLCEGYVLAREDSERMRRGFALSWQHLAHASHPYAPDVARQALERARRLHAVRIRPGGGPSFRLLSRLIGWRAARRLQVLSGRP
ncbi:MAG: glycosyltransferase family 2 protein [Phenylobacterium sp.]|uniref:glycosyltransferase family 2 protein n=1 Tax=Phenylobacterium sp. TaxID=1871053 RepID=UPI00391AC5B5